MRAWTRAHNHLDASTRTTRRLPKSAAASTPARSRAKPRTTSTSCQSPRLVAQEPRRRRRPRRRAARLGLSSPKTRRWWPLSSPCRRRRRLWRRTSEGEATKEQLAPNALRTEPERAREINGPSGRARRARRRIGRVPAERAAALRDALEQATRDAEKEARLRREAEETLHAERAQSLRTSADE